MVSSEIGPVLDAYERWRWPNGRKLTLYQNGIDQADSLTECSGMLTTPEWERSIAAIREKATSDAASKF